MNNSIPTINFFKIKLILNSITNVLKLVFKERWRLNQGSDWVAEYGYQLSKSLKHVLPKTTDKTQNKSTLSIIETGNLNNWSLPLLCDIVVNYHVNSKDEQTIKRIEQENKLILEIKEIKEHFLKIFQDFSITDETNKQMREGLLKCLGVLVKENSEQFIQEIINRIDVLLSKEEMDQLKIGGDSIDEIEANKFVERAEIEFENENYQRSIDCFNDALLYQGFNDVKRAYILSRSSMVNLKYYQNMMLDGEYSYLFYIKKQQLEDSKTNAILACSLCPLLSEPYVRGAQISCFLGYLERALIFIGAALFIEPDNEGLQTYRDQIQQKLDSRILSSDGKTREFEKEAEHFIEAHKYSNYYSGDDLQLEMYIKGIEKTAEIYQLPRQHFINIACSRVAGTFSKKKEYQLAYKYLSHAANGDYAINAYRLGSIYERGLGVEKNLDTALSLYYEASLKPFKFDIPEIPDLTRENRDLMERNDGVTMANVILGHIFSKGIGAEIDMDQAIYYYKRAIDQANSTEAMLALAQIYFYGMHTQYIAIPNKKLAIDLVKRGADLGDKDCLREHYHFTGTKPPNRLTGEGINASIKSFVIIMSVVILSITISSKLLIDHFNNKKVIIQ